MKPSLCLNMIVKNEAARIERCLSSVLPYVKAVAVLDTGSTDNTIDLIYTTCEAAGVPCHVEQGSFIDFSQARNEAFNVAREHVGTTLPFCQFALLVDADMEMKVDNESEFYALDANAHAYDMMQKGGAVSYANRRIVNLSWPRPPYVGVTHEYLDVPAAGMIKGARFIDHADGSNRADKFDRDVALLTEALKSDPNNGRSWYYLAGSYRDAGKHIEAIAAYDRRIALGGWDEETHSAMMHRAGCFAALGDHKQFVEAMIAAYAFRPTRAEPLYDLAKHYREKGLNAAALLFAKRGLEIKRPDDILFVNDFVYDHGLRYEYSIAGYYDPAERSGSFAATNALALDATCPPFFRANCRQNLFWHTQPLEALCPSFTAKRIGFAPPEGYVAMNPSVETHNGVVNCNIRCVNYRIDEHGRYLINGTDGTANGTNPIDTRNFLVKLDQDMKAVVSREIVWDRGPPAFDLVTGLEDVRLYRDRDELCFSACVRELHENGMPQQVRGRLERTGNMIAQVFDLEEMSGDRQCEKNWMHLRGSEFVYRLNHLYDASLKVTTKFEYLDPTVYVDEISGSSQCVPFRNGYLAVVHEAVPNPSNGKRTYWHRFVWLTPHGQLHRISAPFVFFNREIEFCAGLAPHPDGDDFLISFGVRDNEAWVARVSAFDIGLMLFPEVS